ncbi:ATP-binding protein [Vibrio sp. SCSIO 43140]|uniref:PAS domain-containing hybrid sensor histidine kinase/response regulator n=1 Tax=Vibrio sp. SCSIO 43140 TaxID=2819100 RepID=UPI002075C8CF|nr:ATP-binding protein [Vibrio sp. SCSIO 43140]
MMLKGLSGKTLVLIYTIFVICVFTIASIGILGREAQSAISSLQNSGTKLELHAAKLFVEEYLDNAKARVQLASSNKDIISLLSDDKEINLDATLHRYEGDNRSVLFAVFNKDRKVLYEDKFRHPSRANEIDIFNTMKAQASDLLKPPPVYLLHNDTEHICIKIFMPIMVGDKFIGMVFGETPVDYDELFGELIDPKERWYALTQGSVSDYVRQNALESWLVNDVKIATAGLTLMQGLNPAFIKSQVDHFMTHIYTAIAIVIGVSFVLVLFAGNKVLVNPHRELEASQKELAQKNAELIERERESKLLATVVKAARDAVVITDKKGTIEWVNRAFEEMTGYALESVQGKKPGHFLQGEKTEESTKQRIAKSLAKGLPIKAEILNYDSQGREYWVDIDITPISDENGNLDRFIAIERDVTEYKKLENTLTNTARVANAANEAKSAFLATMSHEIRTPMNGVLGLTQILEKEITDPNHREVLQLILSSGNHLVSILNDILDISKIENEALTLEHSPFKMTEILSPVKNTYQSLCSEKGLLFEVIDNTPPSTQFIGDQVRLRQILLNLVGNALKFTQKGSIVINVEVTGGGMCRFEVKDTGIGITPERLDSVFEKFEQAEASTTRQFGGTGLGLSIVRSLVELMGGEILVDSKVGQGSTFTVLLPLPSIVNEKKNEETHEVAHVDFSSYRVLLVDDNAINRIVAAKFCQSLGIEVESCSNGAECLEMFNPARFNLVILDNHMPVMNGPTAASELRKRYGEQILIFGWTADVISENREEFVASGVDTVIAKPLIKRDLEVALRNYLVERRIKKIS